MEAPPLERKLVAIADVKNSRLMEIGKEGTLSRCRRIDITDELICKPGGSWYRRRQRWRSSNVFAAVQCAVGIQRDFTPRQSSRSRTIGGCTSGRHQCRNVMVRKATSSAWRQHRRPTESAGMAAFASRAAYAPHIRHLARFEDLEQR
jgi:hypothetical protein